MEQELSITGLELHYYFDESDDSHSMDAVVRNRCEHELLQIYNELQNELGSDVTIETEAFEVGGLTELWTFLSDNAVQITLLLTALSQALSRIPLRKSKLENNN